MDLDNQIAALCAKAIEDHTFPGCVVGYIREGRSVVLPFGHQKYETTGSPVEAETIYDVASVTKSVVTGTLALKLIEEGRINLDDAVAQHIPELQNDYRNDIRVRHLLTYTVVFNIEGGLAAIAKRAPDKVFEELCLAPLVGPPGSSYFYTNPPSVLLATIIERVCGEPLDSLAKRYFFDPLGMKLTTMRPEALPRFQIAPTEIDDRGEIRAVVHDEAAWAMYKNNNGRLAGNAGLFTTAPDLVQFCQMLLNEGRTNTGGSLLSFSTVMNMHTNQIADLGESTALGWELNWPLTMGDQISNQAFGKTGFTGCSVIIDPLKKAAVVHLSNRLFPKRPQSRNAINQFRRDLANIVFGGLAETPIEAAF